MTMNEVMHVKSTLHDMQLISINLLFLLPDFILKTPWYAASCRGCRTKASVPCLKQPTSNSWLLWTKMELISQSKQLPQPSLPTGTEKTWACPYLRSTQQDTNKKTTTRKIDNLMNAKCRPMRESKTLRIKEIGSSYTFCQDISPQVPPSIHRKNWIKPWEIFIVVQTWGRGTQVAMWEGRKTPSRYIFFPICFKKILGYLGGTVT